MVADLIPERAAALEAWAARVRANNAQADAYREGAPPSDFYAPTAASFRSNPHRTDDETLETLRSLVQPGETWLDIGAGGGGYALPLALLASRVIAVEPSSAMLAILREGMGEHGISNIDIVEATWPMSAGAPSADVALISHIGYDIADIGPFLDEMEASTRRLCVAILLWKSPPYLAEPFWRLVHGVDRARLPGLQEFLVLQLARGKLCEVRLVERGPARYSERTGPLNWLYQQLFVSPESEKGARLRAALDASMTERDGMWELAEQVPLGIVTWKP